VVSHASRPGTDFFFFTHSIVVLAEALQAGNMYVSPNICKSQSEPNIVHSKLEEV
jgi:hypothetical protein